MHRPTLIVYCGLPGVGKSVASAYTAEQLPAKRYRSDEVRKDLFSDPAYTDEETAATYAELLSRARDGLSSGVDVVLDATFRSKRLRERAAVVARETGADAQFVHVTCDRETVRSRIENRTDTVSDAAFDQHLELRREFDPLERDHVVIDNSGTIAETHAQLERSVL